MTLDYLPKIKQPKNKETHQDLVIKILKIHFGLGFNDEKRRKYQKQKLKETTFPRTSMTFDTTKQNKLHNVTEEHSQIRV